MKRQVLICLMIVATLFSIFTNYNQHQRVRTASEIFIESGVDAEKYRNAIDYTKTVTMYSIKKGDKLIQYQIVGAPQGNFYGLPGSKPTELGISEWGYDPNSKMTMKKELRTYIVTKDMEVLGSYAAPVVDDWSTPEIETQTEGHKLQFFSTCKSCFELQ